jgi:hypothetical protein
VEEAIMTNWCKNLVTISNDNREVIKAIADAFERDELFDVFIPCPKELEKLTSLKPNDALVKKIVAKYGAEDWYLWRLDNWGTKWDTGRSHGTLTVVRPTKIKLVVKTAWTPPIPIFDRWVDLGCRVRARFWEPEMDVADTYVDKSVNAIRLARVRNEASRMKM